MIFQHDACPAHYRITIRQLLDNTYPNKWIGRGEPIPWPAWSPPLDFYVWGHMKAEEMKRTFSTRVTKTEVRKRIRTCIRNQEQHIEQDLYFEWISFVLLG
ncbi:unnamed protein product [Callosobruchus maculatus]|uniref:Tc1-like transposase DDE domain-containing protein n=1 Tax=Callosobruchus maculatus TaxID=64391 RepID=A0A653DH35_CALMS|nr:unnamed protein product [Callosobruchus maculatus]